MSDDADTPTPPLRPQKWCRGCQDWRDEESFPIASKAGSTTSGRHGKPVTRQGPARRGLCGDCYRASKRKDKAVDVDLRPTPPTAVCSPPPPPEPDPTAPEPVERTWALSPPGPRPTPRPPPPPPLEAAYQAHAEAAQKRDLKREHRALFEENLRLQTELEAMRRAGRAPDILVYSKPVGERSDSTACALLSDWHVEEPVDAASVHGLNEYNLDIARSRSEFFFKHLLTLTDMMAADSRITTIFLGFLGDLFSGYIHEELAGNNLLGPGDAAHFTAGLLCSGIDFLLRESSYVIEGEMIPGNHGRMTKQVWHGDPTGTSLETFLYHAVAARYEGNPRVRLNVSEQAMRYRRFYERFNMRLIHGYEVKYGGGVGGLTIPLRKALAQWNNPIRADLTVLGHFHQFLDGGDFLVNGSLIGYNTFAQAIKASYEEARQAFFLINARGGGEKSVVAPIWLDDRHKLAAKSEAA